MTAGNATRHEVGDARAEVGEQMRNRLDELASLSRIARGEDVEQFSNDEVLALGLAYGQPGAIPVEQLQEEAEQRLNEYPLCVERTVSFEIVIGTGGPDDRLVVECDVVPTLVGHELTLQEPGGSIEYEIRRILYRYSWTGSAEVELVGEDRQVAEEFARRLVPELVE